jgi:predicted glycosyltransferase
VRILVDITHPAHVHFFRHAIACWRERGHAVLVTSRRKDLAGELLQRLGLAHQDLGAAGRGLPGLALELVARTRRLRRAVRRFRPDVLTAIGGVFVAHAGRLAGVPSVVFYDTEHATLQNLLTYPVCTTVVTPRCYAGWVPRAKHRTYAGYQELAYTHPRRFAPDPGRLPAFGLGADEPYVVMRLVAWRSAHDTGDHGFVAAEAAVRELAGHGRVVISSERPLPPALAPFRLTGPPEDVHHVLALARLYIGESATMASESATLGTPAILVSTSGRGYTDEQERRYGLTYTFRHPRTGQRDAMARARALLADPGTRAAWQARRARMLEDVVDVTEEVVRTVEAHGAAAPAARRSG